MQKVLYVLCMYTADVRNSAFKRLLESMKQVKTAQKVEQRSAAATEISCSCTMREFKQVCDLGWFFWLLKAVLSTKGTGTST